MKAVVQYKYGSPDVLELKEVDKPVVKDDEVLVRVHAAAVDPGVWHLMTGLPYLVRIMGYGLLKPKTSMRGMDVAGRVEAVDRTYPLSDVPEAIRYLENGHARGKVVITV